MCSHKAKRPFSYHECLSKTPVRQCSIPAWFLNGAKKALGGFHFINFFFYLLTSAYLHYFLFLVLHYLRSFCESDQNSNGLVGTDVKLGVIACFVPEYSVSVRTLLSTTYHEYCCTCCVL